LDSTNVTRKNSETMLLLIGDKTSKFLSLTTFLKDSINEHSKSSSNLQQLMAVPKTAFNHNIFKNYPQGKITNTENVFKDYYKYEEPINLFNWTITNETKTISGYNCQKATTTFAGRDYVAWFTNEIPIADGPYKFNGLPGLIVKINDTKNHYEYKLTSFKKVTGNIGFIERNYIKTTKKEFKKAKKEFSSNIFERLQQNGITVTSMNASEKRDFQKRISKNKISPIEKGNE
tara:strand:+ start:4790 stop:5485 length:696 start_codon:yes stop_codon:yes gene_type:complete